MSGRSSQIHLILVEEPKGLPSRIETLSKTVSIEELDELLRSVGSADLVSAAIGQRDVLVRVVFPSDDQPSSDSAVRMTGTIAEEIAVRLFSRTTSSRGVFQTSNEYLLEKVFLPTQLAQDGDGVLFDERIVDRLFQLGVLPTGAEVLSVVDLGGWDSLATLDARISVSFVVAGQQRERTLVGAAIVPTPPITVAEMESEYRRRVLQLEYSGVAHAVLSIERGVLYQLETQELRKFAGTTGIEQLASIAVRLDLLLCDRKTGYHEGLRDYGLSGDRNVAAEELSVIGRLGDTLVWGDVRVRMDELSDGRYEFCVREHIRMALQHEERSVFDRLYEVARTQQS